MCINVYLYVYVCTPPFKLWLFYCILAYSIKEKYLWSALFPLVGIIKFKKKLPKYDSRFLPLYLRFCKWTSSGSNLFRKWFTLWLFSQHCIVYYFSISLSLYFILVFSFIFSSIYMSTGLLSTSIRWRKNIGFEQFLNWILNDEQMLNQIKLNPSRSWKSIRKIISLV